MRLRREFHNASTGHQGIPAYKDSLVPTVVFLLALVLVVFLLLFIFLLR